MPAAFPGLVRRQIPNVSNEAIATIEARYPYPPDMPERLAIDWTTDIVFACNAFNVARAYGDRGRRLLFSVPPASHGSDVPCQYYADSFNH
jgi:hypothetical protein